MKLLAPYEGGDTQQMHAQLHMACNQSTLLCARRSIDSSTACICGQLLDTMYFIWIIVLQSCH